MSQYEEMAGIVDNVIGMDVKCMQHIGGFSADTTGDARDAPTAGDAHP